MHILEAIILGIIQGLTEFIPISSSGHLVIAQTFLSGASDHLLLEFINIGTLLVLLVFFRKKIINIIHQVVIERKYRLALNILITAIPAGIIGYLLAGFIETTSFFSSLMTVAISLAAVGIVMVLIERLPKASPVKDGEQLSVWRALVIGLIQILALIPGVSRSGSTILVGRFVGLNSSSAAEYSFLASLPIMIGVTIKIIVSDHQYLQDNLGVVIATNATAFIAGIVAVGFLMKYLSRHSLAVFGWYRIGLAAIVMTVLLIQ